MITRPTGLSPDSETISIGEAIVSKENLFDGTNYEERAYIDSSGEIHHGAIHSYYDFAVTDFIEVESGTPYIISGQISGRTINWYDENEELLKTEQADGYSGIVTSPENAKYVRVNFRWSGQRTETQTLTICKGAKYDKALTLSGWVQGNSNIETFEDDDGNIRAYSRLTIWDNNIYYHFDFSNNTNKDYAPYVIEDNSGFQIVFKLKIEQNKITGTYYEETTNSKRTTAYVSKKTIDFFNLIKSGRELSWRMRLYEKGTITGSAYSLAAKIGYGTISEVHAVNTYSSSSYVNTGYNFAIFPHQNIYDDVIGFFSEYGTSSSTSIDDDNRINSSTLPKVVDTFYNSQKDSDANIKYWLVCDSYILPIYKYRYYDYVHDNPKSSDTRGLIFADDFDSYGNPLTGYAVFEGDAYTTLQGISNTSSFFEGRTYSIDTNYIDSKWAYFSLYDDPEITIKDDKGESYDNEDVYPLTYSSLQLNAEYSQSQGIRLNYFSYKVYVFNEETDEYELEYSSGNSYNSATTITYDGFFSDKKYKIVILFTDIKQRTYERTLYFTTAFPSTDPNLVVDVSYYKPHNSIIIDWSDVQSIMPSEATNIDKCIFGYVMANDTVYYFTQEENNLQKKSLYIPSDSSLHYSHDDYGRDLKFSGKGVAIKFYGTNLTNGTLFEFGSKDELIIKVEYLQSRYLRITTNNYCNQYDLYTSDDTTKIVDNLSLSPDNYALNIPYEYPTVWDDELVWDDNYYWNEYNNICAEWQLIITDKDTQLSGTPSVSADMEEQKTVLFLPGKALRVPTSSYMTLYGDVIYDKIEVTTPDNLGKFEYSYGTVFFCDFNGHYNGANVVTDLSNLIGYKVYKTMGSSDKLYQIAEITYDESCIIEDFVVGDNCFYTYYIYPIIRDDDGNETVSTPMVSEPIILDDGVDKVFGLEHIGNNIYNVVSDEVWRIYLNLDDSGYTLNTDKSFYDTFARYNQESVGNRKYITKSISGLIGYIDCSSVNGFVDTYDMLISWNNFTSSPNMKCLVDSRGLILPGNFEANPTVEYMKAPGSPATAKFNWRQKSDLDIIKIYASVLPFNPTKGTYLKSSDGYYLTSNDPSLLYTSK